MEVLRRVFVLRRVAAADVAATQAQAQMHPRVPRLETILSPVRARRDGPHLIEMRALISTHIFPFLFPPGVEP